MKTFKRQAGGGFIDLETGAAIPEDARNRDRAAIDRLILAGEATVLPADPVPAPDAAESRRAEYAARLPVYAVIEALLEAEAGDRTRLDAVLTEFAAIQSRHPVA